MPPSAHPARLRHRIGQLVAERGLWRPGDRVAVAVSGGLDSVVLLDLLVEIRDWHRAALSVATVDHGTRPGSSADADFVEALATSRGLRCFRHRAALGEGASEEACRAARLAFFGALPVDRVALAHHRHDQAETVLLALLRGTGLRGLSAMGHASGRLVRPLLEEPRAALLAWARHRGLRWVDDPTNDQPDFLRNRVRHEVMPLLESLRPGAAAALARSARLAALDEACLEDFAADFSPEGLPDASTLLALPEPLSRRLLLRWLPAGAGASHVEAVLALLRRGRGAVALPGGSRVRLAGDILEMESDDPRP